jgi:hypothetical protein
VIEYRYVGSSVKWEWTQGCTEPELVFGIRQCNKLSVNSYDINIVKTTPMWFFGTIRDFKLTVGGEQLNLAAEGRKADQFQGGGGVGGKK